MAALRLIDALPDFGAPSPSEGVHDAAPGPAVPNALAPSGPSTDELIRAAVERAEQEVAMRLSVEHEATLLAERQRHEAEIAQMQATLGEQAGVTISARLDELGREASQHASAAVARILSGVLSENLLERSVEALGRSVAAAIQDSEAIRVEVRAPQFLFEALSKALAGRAANLHHIESEGFDLSVSLDGTVMETRLSEWSATLSRILE
ncbi:hypothetical protein KEU06_17125 [Pseudaminobacter sp. 19-2017]|uniref:Uncharacterized protein n=1 Tax=Pseudaminobacter soli (ex Zhang et al. 2022) TaxID=2831468 RepID=A0A942E4D7_9HYPH|nr:hypothetical protein [Pseudaminobacter soli]MBS3650340.1 hypothetical protein [Pseudaminobacter soli]